MSARKGRLPLTIPTRIETKDGIDWLTFVYTSKGLSTDYEVRIDVNSVETSSLDSDFRLENSVYPKAALVSRADYKGNRWEYETSVNEIGWKLSHLNPILLGKRGLLQRAVDRNTNPRSKSRRVARVEKTLLDKSQESIPKKAKLVPTTPTPSIAKLVVKKESRPKVVSPYTLISPDFRLIVETVKNAAPYRIRLRMDINEIPENAVDWNFMLLTQPFAKPKCHREFLCNSIAWKLAYLNYDILFGNIELIQRSVDVYMDQYEEIKSRAGLRMMERVFNE